MFHAAVVAIVSMFQAGTKQQQQASVKKGTVGRILVSGYGSTGGGPISLHTKFFGRPPRRHMLLSGFMGHFCRRSRSGTAGRT